MLSIEPIARVVVNAARTAAAPSVFDTGLLLVKDSSFTAAKRLKAYTSGMDAAAGLIADGFAATTEAYKSAVKYFAASPAPGKLLVSCYPSSETPAQALAAVLNETADFYGVALGAAETDERILALEAAVNPNTVQHAFAELESDGLILSKGTLGRFVTEEQAVIENCRKKLARQAVNDFLKNMSNLSISKEEAIALMKEAEE